MTAESLSERSGFPLPWCRELLDREEALKSLERSINELDKIIDECEEKYGKASAKL